MANRERRVGTTEPGGDAAWPCPSPPSHHFPPHGPGPAPRGLWASLLGAQLAATGTVPAARTGSAGDQWGHGVLPELGASPRCLAQGCRTAGGSPLPGRDSTAVRGSQESHRPAQRKSIHFIIDPRSTRGRSRTVLYWTFPFSAREREEGNKTNQPYSLLFRAREHTSAWQREAVGERGTSREGEGPAQSPPGDACEELAMHLETHEQQTHFAAPARTYPAHPSAAGEPPSQQPLTHSHPRPTRATVPGGLSDWNLVAGEEGGGRGGQLARVPPQRRGGPRPLLYSSPRSAAMGSLVHLSETSWLSV